MPTTMIAAVANQWAVLLFRGLAALALAFLIEAWPVVNMSEDRLLACALHGPTDRLWSVFL